MTRLALVNAIYFKGNWMNRFDAANTKEMPFKVNQVKTHMILGKPHPDVELNWSFINKTQMFERNPVDPIVPCVSE